MSAVIDESAVEQCTEVRAVLNYTHDSGSGRSTILRSAPGRAQEQRRNRRPDGDHPQRPSISRLDSRCQRIRNDLAPKYAHRLASFQDGKRVKAVDYPEIEAALKARTGADKVVVFDL